MCKSRGSPSSPGRWPQDSGIETHYCQARTKVGGASSWRTPFPRSCCSPSLRLEFQVGIGKPSCTGKKLGPNLGQKGFVVQITFLCYCNLLITFKKEQKKGRLPTPNTPRNPVLCVHWLSEARRTQFQDAKAHIETCRYI